MAWWTWPLVAITLIVAITITAAAFSRPILFRMAARNATRRPRQTATVIAGLMVGTAIISAALVAGDSAGYAIRGFVYQSMGHIDESVSLPGYPYFSEEVYIDFAEDNSVEAYFDGVTGFAIWEVAAEDTRTQLFEPSAYIVGIDPATATNFGVYIRPDGSSIDPAQLQRGTVILSDHLATELDAEIGDELHLAFTPPVDPAVPEITPFFGNISGVAIPGLPLPAQPLEQRHDVFVNASATRIISVVGYDPRIAPGLPPTTSLQAQLVDPEGNVRADSGEVGPGAPIWLNYSAEPETSLQVGTWQIVVTPDVATQAPYGGVGVVMYPVFDLARLRERAEALQAEYGPLAEQVDALDPFSQRREATFVVADIASEGRIDQFDFRMAIHMHLRDTQSMLGREGEVNYIGFSNQGGVEEGVLYTDDAMVIINGTLTSIQARFPDAPAIQYLDAANEKQQFLRIADDAGETLTSLLVFAGSLSIITGLLLILNIFTMLAEERRSDLGMARAVGLGRRDLVRLFLFEGSLYAVVAAAIGAVLGLGLAYIMILVMNIVIAQLGEGLSIPPVVFRPSLEAILLAFSTGALLTFITIWFSSLRQSKLNIVRAIRRIEEPEKSGSWTAALWAGTPLLALGTIATIIAWLPMVGGTGKFSMQVFGPLALIGGLSLMLRPVLKRRFLYPLAAAVLLAYYTTTMFVITRFDNLTEANTVGPLRGVVMTLSAVVLLVYFERGTRALGRLLASWKKLRAVAVPAVSYPLHRKFRTGMTLAMFALVILSIGFFSIFGSLFDTDPDRQTGGFDIEGRTTLSVANLDDFDQGLVDPSLIEVRHDLVDFETEDPKFITVEGGGTGRLGDFRHHVYGYNSDFASDNDFRLLWRSDAYDTDEEAYQAVLDRDDAIIVGYLYSTDERNQDLSYEVGDMLQMNLGTDVLEYEIVGIQEQFHHAAVWLPEETVRGLFPTVEGLFLYRVTDGANAGEVARQLERNYREVGMDADDARAEVLREQESFRNILSAMKLFLGLGLIVGVLSLGIITSRSVLERRQEIGMLRALGFTGRQVRSMFFVEVTYTLVLGAAAGLACAILVTYGLWYAIIRELQYEYGIPWGEIGILLGISYFVALLATFAPIRRSAKVAPAEALRYVE